MMLPASTWKGPALREPWLHGDSLRIAQPFFEIERTVLPASQMKRENLPAGERINAQDAEVLARSVGKSDHTFHDGRGGLDSRDRGYGGQQGIVEAAANFKVGSARCQLRSQSESSLWLRGWQSESREIQ